MDNMESQLEAMDLGREVTDLASEIDSLVEDEKVNEELARLKSEMAGNAAPQSNDSGAENKTASAQ
jgi:phage shock protein A